MSGRGDILILINVTVPGVPDSYQQNQADTHTDTEALDFCICLNKGISGIHMDKINIHSGTEAQSKHIKSVQRQTQKQVHVLCTSLVKDYTQSKYMVGGP